MKLTDFGSSHVKESTNSAGPSKKLGTFYYHSPESFDDVPQSYKSDIWAMGCLIFEIATLNCLFSGSTQNAVYKKIISFKEDDIKIDNIIIDVLIRR